MIPTIIIIGSALYWLLLETDWLRVNLMGKLVHQAEPEIDSSLDIESDYDGSDIEYLEAYEAQLNEAIYNADYQTWLDERYAITCTVKPRKSDSDRRRDKLNFRDTALYQTNIRGMYQNKQVEV